MTTLTLPPATTDRATAVRSRMTLALAVAAGPLLVVANALIPELGRDAAGAVATLGADPAVAQRFLWSQLLYATASLFFLPLTLLVWRTQVRRGSVLRLTGGLLVVVGMVSNALSLTVWAYLLRMGTGSGVEDGALVDMLAFGEGGLEQLPISYLAIPVAVLGIVLLGIGLLRAAVVPAWAPVLLVVGGVAAGAGGAGVRALFAVPLAVGCVGVALALTRPRQRR